MERRDYEDKLEKWEAEGYDVSKLRRKWFPAKKRRVVWWWPLAAAVIIAAVIMIVGWQLSQSPVPIPPPTTSPTQIPAPKPTPKTTPVPAPEPTPVPAPEPVPTPTPEPTPIPGPPPKQDYTLSGGPSDYDSIIVDDDLIIEINEEVIFNDDDQSLSELEPVKFSASSSDALHIIAVDLGGSKKLSGLYLHTEGKIYRITEGVAEAETGEPVFFDETFTISYLPEVNPYALSGGTSPAVPIVVDDDLTIELNGIEIYRDGNKQASTLDPITFAARGGDTMHITASNFLLDKQLSSLYVHWDGNSYKITDGVALSDSDGGVFFEVTINISNNGEPALTKTTTTPTPTPTPIATASPNTNTAATPTLAPFNGSVAGDIPGTLLPIGSSLSSVVDKDTKPRDVYAINLTAGQEILIKVTGHPNQLNFILATLDSTSFDNNLFTQLYNSTGSYTYSPWSYKYVPATTGMYYFAVTASYNNQPYTIEIIATGN